MYDNGIKLVPVMATKKKQNPRPKAMTWRPTPADYTLMRSLSDKLGIRATNVLRLALRKLNDSVTQKVA